MTRMPNATDASAGPCLPRGHRLASEINYGAKGEQRHSVCRAPNTWADVAGSHHWRTATLE